jgi:hypothetical protein
VTQAVLARIARIEDRLQADITVVEAEAQLASPGPWITWAR